MGISRCQQLGLVVGLQLAGSALFAGTVDLSQGETNILVLGDSGTGKRDQYRVARQMSNFCFDQRCDFAVLLGDNIYEVGTKDPVDPQFISKFEEPYSDLHFKFYVALGNHDVVYRKQGVRAQIKHTEHSNKWVMLDRYYKFREKDAEFFVIDSNTFGKDDPEQVAWLKKSLKKSKSKWKFVMGHHPIYSVGEHKFWDIFEGFKLKKLKKSIEPLLCENGVDAYLSGHEHHLELDLAKCGTVHIISGAAAKKRRIHRSRVRLSRTHRFSVGMELGFAHMSLRNDHFWVTFVDKDGMILHQDRFEKHRNKKNKSDI